MRTKLILLLVGAFTMNLTTAQSLSSNEIYTAIEAGSEYAEGMPSVRSATPGINLVMADNSGHGGYKMGKCWVKNDPYQDDDPFDDDSDDDSFDDDND